MRFSQLFYYAKMGVGGLRTMEVRNSRFLRTIPLMLIVMLLCPFAYGKVIYVDDGQANFDNIQSGIDNAESGDTVLVAPGEYVIAAPITFRGKAITVKSEAGRDETTIRMGTPADTNRGSVVIFENNETAASILDGFTITGGSGSWVPSHNTWGGGGIFFDASSATVRNCAIVQNSAEHGGGVMVYSGSSTTFINCKVMQNTAKNVGGVMVIFESSTTLTNCIIKGNSATGVTMYVDGFGGGLSCAYNSLLTLTNCSITGNSAGISSGGVFCGTDSSVTMTHCTITNNTSQRYCGVMECAHGSVFLTNCLLARNTGAWNGGALGCVWSDSSMTISNCTIWGNKGGRSAGGVGCWHGSSVTVTNSIIWENTAPVGREIEVRDFGSTLDIAYSNVAGGQNVVSVEGGSVLNWGEGNIDVDPLFAKPGYWADVNDLNVVVEPDDPNAVWIDGDFHLKSQAGRWTSPSSVEPDPNSQNWIQDDVTSPCIDVGDPNSYWSAELWPHGERINMGAYGGTSQASRSLSDAGNVADLNRDGIVDSADMRIMVDHWGTDEPLCDIGPMPWGDGIVDVQDLIVLAEHLFEEREEGI